MCKNDTKEKLAVGSYQLAVKAKTSFMLRYGGLFLFLVFN